MPGIFAEVFTGIFIAEVFIRIFTGIFMNILHEIENYLLNMPAEKDGKSFLGEFERYLTIFNIIDMQFLFQSSVKVHSMLILCLF